MPNIIIKDEYGQDEVWEDVNTVRFLDENHNLVSYRYDPGEVPTPEREDLLPAPDGMHWVGFLDRNGELIWNTLVDDGSGISYPDIVPEAPDTDMEFYKWNYSLQDLSAIRDDLVVAPVFKFKNIPVTDTVLKIRTNVSTTSFSLYINVQGNHEALEEDTVLSISWGDGSTSQCTISANLSQTYFSFSHSYTKSAVTVPFRYIVIHRESGFAHWSLGYATGNPITSDPYTRIYRGAGNSWIWSPHYGSSHATNLAALQYGTDNVCIGIAGNSDSQVYFTVNILADELETLYIANSGQYCKHGLIALPPIQYMYAFSNSMSAGTNYCLHKNTTLLAVQPPVNTTDARSQTAYNAAIPNLWMHKYNISLSALNVITVRDFLNEDQSSVLKPYDIYLTNVELNSSEQRVPQVFPNYGSPYLLNYIYTISSGSCNVTVYGDIVYGTTNPSASLEGVLGAQPKAGTFLKIYGDIYRGTYSSGVLAESTDRQFCFSSLRCDKLYMYGSLNRNQLSLTGGAWLGFQPGAGSCSYIYIQSIPSGLMSTNPVYTYTTTPYMFPREWINGWSRILELGEGNFIPYYMLGSYTGIGQLRINPVNYTYLYNYAYCNSSTWTPRDVKVIDVPEGVRSIYSYAFHNCTTVERINLPSTLISLTGTYAFYNCYSLKDVYLYSDRVVSLSTTSNFWSGTRNPGMRFHVRASLLASYKAASNWSSFAAYFVGDIPDEE